MVRVVSEERWRRAQEFELDFQRRKAQHLEGRERVLAAARGRYAASLAELLSPFFDLLPGMRVLEVGAGPHGAAYFLAAGRRVALDPLAVFYQSAFAALRGSSDAESVAGRGEELPFAEGTFDLVISDNVLDHTRDPTAMLAEMRRVLSAAGVLYLAVDVHTWSGSLLSRLHEDWVAPRRVLAAFGPHPFCFRTGEVERQVAAHGLRIVARQLDSLPIFLGGGRGSWSRFKGWLVRILFGSRFLRLICVRAAEARQRDPA